MSLLLSFILGLIAQSECARILAVFPVPSISHQVVFRPITQELARRGHEVIVVTPDPAFPKGKAPPNLTEIDVHDISYSTWEEEYVNTHETDAGLQVQLFFKLFNKIFEVQTENEEFKKILTDKTQSFDLLLLEACVPMTLILSHIFKVPVIQISSAGGVYSNYESIGAPVHPVLYPILFQQRLYDMTIWEKITQLYKHYKMEILWFANEKEMSKRIKQNYGTDFPSLDELKNNIHMMFLNFHAIWEDNRPVPPGLVYMGGIHQKPRKDLPKDLQEYLDNSKNGAIYMSLGTNVKPSLLPPEQIKILVNVFSKLPYNILLKWDSDEVPTLSKNVKVSKWFPQSDVLPHPNLKLFITQGGLQSTDEAITAGVPLIAFPVMADQWYNAEKYVRHKIGIKLDIYTVTEEELLNAINTIIGSQSYYENIRRLKHLMEDEPQKPLERATWWIEHVIRHKGAKHLRSPIANISWSEYLQLDVVTVLFIAVFISISILYAISRLIIKGLSKNLKLKSS